MSYNIQSITEKYINLKKEDDWKKIQIESLKKNLKLLKGEKKSITRTNANLITIYRTVTNHVYKGLSELIDTEKISLNDIKNKDLYTVFNEGAKLKNQEITKKPTQRKTSRRIYPPSGK